MSGDCIVVPSRSRRNIRYLAQAFRDMCGAGAPYFDVVRIMDVWLTKQWEGYALQLLPREEMGADLGKTYPDDRIVQVREDVYDDACRGDGFARFTMAHELGHVLLHRDIPMKRVVQKTEVKPYNSSEWQADTFAGELLMPIPAVLSCPGEASLVDLCGVSFSAARVRFQVMQQEGLIEKTDP